MPIDPNLLRGSGNPVLDEIADAPAKLSPQAKIAMERARASFVPPPAAVPQQPEIAPPSPEMNQAALQPMRPAAPMQPQQPQVAAPSPQMDQAALKPMAPPQTPTSPLSAAPMSVAHNRLQELTKPPVPGLEHTTASTGQSGIGQIHNPWARIPLQIADAIGGGLFPRISALLPGTQLHHDREVAQASGRTKQEDDFQNTEAKRGLESAQAANAAQDVPLREAQANEANAKADALRNPKPDKTTGSTFEDSEGNVWVIHGDGTATAVSPQGTQLKGKPKSEPKGDIKEDDQGNYVVIHPDGTTTPVMQGDAPLKGKPGAEKTVAPEQQFIDEYRRSNPAATIAQAQHAYAINHQAPQHEPRSLMIDPATGKAILVQPGSTVPKGAITAAGQNTINTPTETERSAGGRADTMLDLDSRIRAALNNPLIQQGTGPLAGRISEIQNSLGTLPHDLSELKNDLVSYGAFQAGLHPVRGIGGLQYFDKVMGGLGQEPGELLGKLDSNKATAESVKRVAGTGGSGGSNAVDPALKAYADKYFNGDINKAKAHNSK